MLATRSDGIGDGGDLSIGMVMIVSGDGVSGEIAEDGDVYMCQQFTYFISGLKIIRKNLVNPK